MVKKSYKHFHLTHKFAEVLKGCQGAPASPGNLLEIQILRPHPKPTKSETLRVELNSLCLNMVFFDSEAGSSLRTTGLKESFLFIVVGEGKDIYI